MPRKKTPAATVEKTEAPMSLKNVEELAQAHEWLFNQQVSGKIDAKTADALNTTLKGSTYLRATLPLKVIEALSRIAVKKVKVPSGVLQALLPSMPPEETTKS